MRNIDTKLLSTHKALDLVAYQKSKKKKKAGGVERDFPVLRNW